MNSASSPAPEGRNTDEILAEAAALLDEQPEVALDLSEAALRECPGLPGAELIACKALRRLGQLEAALARLDALAAAYPRVPAVNWELAQVASARGDGARAIAALKALTGQQPGVPGGWFLLASELRKAGRAEEAWEADLKAVNASARDRELLDAAIAMNEERLDESETALIARIERHPDDAAAIRLLGEVKWRQGNLSEAQTLVERALELAPGFDLARAFLVRLLLQANQLRDALEQAETLMRSPMQAPAYDLLLASVLVRLGDQEKARDIYLRALERQPDQPQVWQNLGHVLKTMGSQQDAVHAYRQAVRHQPTMGEAWWSLANLKTVRLGDADIAAMEAALTTLEEISEDRREDTFHLHFSLGKAREDKGDFAASFRHYDAANRLRRGMVRHDAHGFSKEVAMTADAFAAEFLALMGEGGCLAPDPIFVVGLPRSGSTLVEQILSSHSLVEGTMELPEMMIIASRLQSRIDDGEFTDLREVLSSLTPADRRRLGEEYIERTRVHRKTSKPHFIDKMPNNWQNVGLIKLILPNARIIDVRRHPMSCCFSGWKQHFARGQAFSYDLGEIGRYYRDYVSLMHSFDAAAPGAVHRIFYEDLVTGTEREVRRLLGHLGLAFEPSCLEFYRNDRAVRTASSEQVRQPIFTGALEHWRNYEQWIDPLVEALGPLVSAYPVVPPE